MRRIHKFLSVILAIMMVLSAVPITAFAAGGVCGANLRWDYNSTKYTLTISGTGDMANYSYSNRPWETYEDKITTVVIADGVTSIGAYAFYSFGKVTSITIPESVTKIGMTAFNACKLLTTVALPSGITAIPDRAFTNCTGLTSITIPANVKTIGSSAFEGCTGLTSIVIPEGVTTIKDKAFASCKGLTSVTIPASVTSIDFSAFENCTNLLNLIIDSNNPNYSSDEFGVLFNKDKTTLIAYPVGSTATSYTVPDTVTTIGANAFKGQTALTKVTIPASVTTIEEYAFYGCSALQNVIFDGEHTALATIGQYAFSECDSLAGITLPDSVTTIGKNAFANNDNFADISIPAGVTTIESKAFVGTALYNNAENWTNDILYIDNYLIVANSSLSGAVQIKDGTRMIADEAFYACTNITSFVIPDGVTTIGNGAFANCSALADITIPASVKTIKDSAFNGCSALKEVYYSGGAKDWFAISIGVQNVPLTSATLLTAPGGEVIVIPGGFIGDVKWFFDENTGVLTISGQGTMEGFENGNRPWEAYAQEIQTVVIENGVTSIGSYAFYNFDNLSSVILPYGLTLIGGYAFGNCDALTEMFLPKTLVTINNNVFANCLSLTGINLENVETIGSSAFYNCSLLENVTLGDNATSIGDSSFAKCMCLASVTIGKGLKTIGKSPFNECYMLESFTVDSDNPYFSCDENGVLFNKDKTELILYPMGNSSTSYVMPDSVTTIKSDSFDDSKNLQTLIFSNNLKRIESSAFNECGIKKFIYPDTIEQWEDKVTVGDQNFQLTSETLECAPTDLEAITGRCGDNVIWTLNALTGNMVISGTGAMYDYAEGQKRPWDRYASAITDIVIADGVTNVGTDAFSYCSRLATVTIGNTVTTIGDYAFYECTNLKSLTLGENVTTIGKYVCAFCPSLESLTLPDSVTTIGQSAFFCCESIKNIAIGKGLESFTGNTFGRCTKLETITVDSENPNFSNDEFGVLFNKDKTTLVQYPEGNSRTAYTIPDSVTTIGVNSFFASENLTEVIIPEGVTTIESSSFGECFNLKTVVIPDSITTMGNQVFKYCRKLEKITIPDGITGIGTQTFYNCENLTEIVIPESVTSIDREAFYGCTSLEDVYYKGTRAQWSEMTVGNSNDPLYDATRHFNYGEGDFSYIVISEEEKTIKIIDYNIIESSMKVTIPKTIDGYTVVEIGDKAFYNLDSLVSVRIPDSVTRIGKEAFYDCDDIKSITIPESVVSIGESAFESCFNLSTVMMGQGVTTIENSAFNDCTYLENVYYTGTEEKWNSITIGENNQPLLNATKHFEYGELDSVSGTCGENLTWTLDLYSGKLIISGTGDMYDYSYDNHPWESHKGSIREVVISDGATSIGERAFYVCPNLEAVTIPGSVTTIGRSAFYLCSSLENVTIADGVKVIGNSAFSECESLKSVIIPDSVTLIENSAFYYCDALTTVKLSKNITEINSNTFYYCSNLKEITIPEGVTRIGSTAFSSCVSLTEITIPESVTKISERAFEYCKGLETVTMGAGVKEIGYSAFYYCISLKDVYYSGSQSQWKMISISSQNSDLLDATLHCLGPEHPHEFEIVVTEPTCRDRGYTTYSCECGYIYTDDYVDALGHDYVGVITPPTCTEDGYTTYTCSRCSDSYIAAKPIDPTGHTFVSEIITAPTHLTDGVEKLICKDCGYTNTKPVEKIAEHTYEATVTAPTCTEQGYTTYNCICGDNYIGDYVPMTGHTVEQFESVMADPDCTNDGIKEVVSFCSVCNAGLGVEIVTTPAHGHTPASEAEENYVAPTCTENGSKDIVTYCSVCEEEINRETVILDATGHEDNDKNGYCDACPELLDPTVECDHSCHKGGISGFFWKITLFFSRIFGTNKVCECGALHY